MKEVKWLVPRLSTEIERMLKKTPRAKAPEPKPEPKP